MNSHAYLGTSTATRYIHITDFRVTAATAEQSAISAGLLLLQSIVVRVPVGILHDNGITYQIVAGSVEPEEEQWETDGEQEGQHEVLHHRPTQSQWQAQIGPGCDQNHVRLVRSLHGGYTSTLDYPQAHHVLAGSSTSDRTVDTVLEPESLRRFRKRETITYCALSSS